MLIGINDLHQIKQIRDITDTALTIVLLDEAAESFPFKGWSDTKILCYCYKSDDNGTSIYPYVDTSIIERLEQEETLVNALKARIIQAEQTTADTSAVQQELLELLIDMEVI